MSPQTILVEERWLLIFDRVVSIFWRKAALTFGCLWSLFLNWGPISVRSYPSPTHSYFWQTEPVEIIGLECGVLQLLLFSDIEDNWRIWPSLLSICPHSSLLFHLDFVAAVVFVAVFFAIVTIFGTNCLDPLSLWHCSFSNWIINSSMIWVIIAKSCAYVYTK